MQMTTCERVQMYMFHMYPCLKYCCTGARKINILKDKMETSLLQHRKDFNLKDIIVDFKIRQDNIRLAKLKDKLVERVQLNQIINQESEEKECNEQDEHDERDGLGFVDTSTDRNENQIISGNPL